MNIPEDAKRRLSEGEDLFFVEVTLSKLCPFKSLKAQWVAQKLSQMSEFVDVEPDIEDSSLPPTIDHYTYIFSGERQEVQRIIELDLLKDPEIDTAQLLPLGDHEEEQVAASSVIADEGQKRRKTDTSQTLRVEVSKINALGNLMGELVIGNDGVGNACRLLQQAKSMNEVKDVISDLKKSHQELSRITGELQDRSMEIRMIPIGTVFKKFQRVVRDLAQQKGKKINLSMTGEDTELDKTVTDRLNEPLIHIIRNAVDHGLESPDVRRQLGKSPVGHVSLEASNEGGMVIVKISDDGSGLDIESIQQKAISSGLISPEQLAQMSQKEIFALIFHPGLSTAKEVTDISGRGVGMDVVKTSIGRLGGIIDIQSEKGHGTTFTIKLPLTLSIVNVQLVGIGEETMAIPIPNVQSVFRLQSKDIRTMGGQKVIQRKHDVLPLVPLKDILNISSEDHDIVENEHIVEVVAVETSAGIKVDRVLGQQDVVIKNLGEYLGRVPGISGTTILGNGHVAMILDVRGLIERMMGQTHTNQNMMESIL